MQDPAPAESATVLVVDDNEANRALAQAALEDEGYRVILATGGAEGVRAFQESAPDCILLDVRMPGMDGFAVCEQVRSLPGGRDTPVIFVTALRDVDTFDKSILAGGDDFLTKPVLPTTLTLRVQAALRLRKTSAELRENYRLLREQRDELMRLQLQKERLTAFIVHDLKNPVNSMDLLAQVLLRDSTLSEDARGAVTQIRTEARQLSRMILNLLDVSKAAEGKLTAARRPIELAELLAEVAQELGPSARAAGVSVEVPKAPGRAFADPDLLRRMLANLVENAIRHAPEGSAVKVSVSRRAGETELRVTDSGSGVPMELRDRIFDPFVQGDSSGARNVTRSGRGLGLSFCKLAADAHHGKIWLEDGNPGTIFCLGLPDHGA
jgi:signal transduction histidine kinase